MNFVLLVRATQESESGAMPDPELATAMGKFNEEMVKAGVLLAGEGLHPSSKGARVRFSGGRRTVIDGPFAETKELIAGFWILQCRSKEEALEWAKRSPPPFRGDCENRAAASPRTRGLRLSGRGRVEERGRAPRRAGGTRQAPLTPSTARARAVIPGLAPSGGRALIGAWMPLRMCGAQSKPCGGSKRPV